MDRLNKLDIFYDMIKNNTSNDRKLGLLLQCTAEFKEEIKKMVVYKIDDFITIRMIKGYAYLQVKCKNVNQDNIDTVITLIKSTLLTYSYNIVEFITYDFDIEKVIDKHITLVDIRNVLGITGQTEFAEILGCNQSFLSLMENGEKNLSKKAYIKLKELVPLMDLSYLYFN